jgi:hypothetical protein
MKNTNAHDGRGMRDYKNKFFQTLSEKLSQEIPEVSLAALSLELSKVSGLKIQPQLIDKILSEIIANGVSKNPLTITKEFVTLYRTYMHSEPHKTPDKQLKNYEKEIELAIQMSERQEREIWYNYSTFCTHFLPPSPTDKKEISTTYPNNVMTISSIGDAMLPYGSIPRIIICYLSTEAKITRERTIPIGKTIHDFVKKIGYTPSYIANGTNEQVLEHLERLYRTEFSHDYSESRYLEDGTKETLRHQKSFKIFDEKLSFESVKDNIVQQQMTSVTLSETFFNEIQAHSVPLSLEILKSLKRSPLALDLYVFISYRSNTGRVIGIKLNDLMNQFAIDYEKWRFKQRLTTALTLVKKMWPDCNAIIKENTLIIHNTLPSVPTS